MQDVHTLKFLPSHKAIKSVSVYSEQLDLPTLDYETLLISLKSTVFKNNFAKENDGSLWMSRRGRDYYNNPKLFALAPLTHVCTFISEVFKNFEIEEINRRLPVHTLKQALLRLKSFVN